MANDVRIVAPDQIRQVTVTNQGQSVALDVNVVNAAFSASITVPTTMSIASSPGSPVYVQGAFSASVAPTAFANVTFVLNQDQYQDVTIPDGAGGMALQLNPGGLQLLNGALLIGAQVTGTVFGPLTTIYWQEANAFLNVSAASGAFSAGAAYASGNGHYQIADMAGWKTLRFHNTSPVVASCSIGFNAAPYAGIGRTLAQVTNFPTTTGHSAFRIGSSYGISTIQFTIPTGSNGGLVYVNNISATPSTLYLGIDAGYGPDYWVAPKLWEVSSSQWVTSLSAKGWYQIANMAGFRYALINATNTGEISGTISFTQAEFIDSGIQQVEISNTTNFPSVYSGSLSAGPTALEYDIPPDAVGASLIIEPPVNANVTWHVYGRQNSTDNFRLLTLFDSVNGTYTTTGTHAGYFPITSFAGLKKLTVQYDSTSGGTADFRLGFNQTPFVPNPVVGAVTVVIEPATSSSIRAATLNSTPFSLFVANSNRKGLTVSNSSLSNAAYIMLGPSASYTNYSARIPPNGYYEVPYNYTGLITGATSGSKTASVVAVEVT